MTAAAIGPTTQTRLVPYATPDMIRYHAAIGVQTNALVPGGGSPGEQDAALAEIIEQSSGWIDDQCQQVLAATIDTVVSQGTVGRNGSMVINPRYRPVRAVLSASLGNSFGNLAALPAASLQLIGVQEDTVTLPGWSGLGTTTLAGQPLQFGPSVMPGKLWYGLTYLNGWPVTLLAASAAQAATSITVEDVTGIIEGQTQLFIYSGRSRFRFIAGAVTTVADGLIGPAAIGTGPGSVVCPPLPMAISNNAANPTMVSGLPSNVNKIVQLVVRSSIKDRTRGNTSSQTAAGKEKDPLGAGNDLELAWSMLVNGGYCATTAGTTA